MEAPVIFLTFANDQNEHLALLKRERKSIERTLRGQDDKGQIKVVTESETTIEDIFEKFHAYDGRVSIFHYAGHASGQTLRLEDEGTGSADAQATGLAQFLGQQASLKLVFLNGCGTAPQVELLLKHGVKAVIATTSKIQDKMATEFAEQFYYSLATYNNIETAFNTGTAFIRSKYRDHGGIHSYRGLGAWGGDPTTDELPWGLYLAEGEEDAVNWAIPQVFRDQKNVRNRMSYEERTDVNDILIETVCEDLALYSKKLDAELNEENLAISSIIREIVDCFPLPIGEQLRKLFTRSNDPDKPDEMELFTTARLRQLHNTYRGTMQFISFILLSQLWDEKHKNPELEINEDHVVEFNSFFAINEDTYLSYNYVVLIRTITDIFDTHNIPYFLEELKQLKINMADDDPIRSAHDFMDNIRIGLDQNSIPGDKVEDLCLEAEEELAVVLRGVAFLAKYQMATIKNIELVKRRHESAQYRHIQIELKRAITVASTKITEDGKVFKNFTDNKSVLFLKTHQNEILGYLSLSPFIIDLNALENQYSSKLYLFAYQSDNIYYYQFLNNYDDPRLEVDENRYSGVNLELEKFKANIHGKAYQPVAQAARARGSSRFAKKR